MLKRKKEGKAKASAASEVNLLLELSSGDVKYALNGRGPLKCAVRAIHRRHTVPSQPTSQCRRGSGLAKHENEKRRKTG